MKIKGLGKKGNAPTVNSLRQEMGDNQETSKTKHDKDFLIYKDLKTYR